MPLDLNFELATLGLLGVFLFAGRKKPLLPTRPNRRFAQLCLLVFALNLLEASIAFSAAHGGWLPLRRALLAAYCGAQPALFALALCYCAYSCRLPMPWLRRALRAAAVLTVPVCLLGLASPFAGFYCVLVPQKGVARGPLGWLPVAHSALLLAGCFAVLAARRRHLPRRRLMGLCAMAALLAAGHAAQALVMPGPLPFCVFALLALLAACLTGQNPDRYIHEGAGVFNHRALDELLQEYYHRDLPYRMVFLHTALPGDSRFVFNTDFELLVFSTAARRIRQAMPGACVFFLSRPRSFVVVSPAAPESVSASTERAVAELRGGWQLDGRQVALECTALLFDGRACASGLDEARILVENAFYLGDLPKAASGVLWASDDTLQQLHRLIRVHLAVRRAVLLNRISVAFQPIVDAAGRMCAVEALARLEDPELGQVSPEEFVGAAETSGAILKLGQTVYETVLRSMAQNRGLFERLDYVSVNLSPLQLGQPDLAPRYLELAAFYGVAPGRLAFEITESFHLAHDETLSRTLQRFHKAGARLFIDDFGEGHSNLARILDMPLAVVVKLERHVMAACLARDERLMGDLIGLVHDSGRGVVVEGVENELQFRRLAALGADWMQGFYFSRPLSLDALRDYAAAIYQLQ
ncbi:EAL domain-containing protein [Allofournierella sp.]|uniref:EAL domain-containing protein n=1 Tax=Allofournierella sp. TaxID=1940256 RepID=UPI003AB37D6B